MRRTTKERELLAQIATLERDAATSNAEYARHLQALDGLMRAVLQEVCVEYAFPTSIACGRLIAAVEVASRTVHDRNRN